MHTHISKCKNDKTELKKENKQMKRMDCYRVRLPFAIMLSLGAACPSALP
jgi:hypothetical protein